MNENKVWLPFHDAWQRFTHSWAQQGLADLANQAHHDFKKGDAMHEEYHWRRALPSVTPCHLAVRSRGHVVLATSTVSAS